MKSLPFILTLLTSAVSFATPISSVTKSTPACYERAYGPAHMRSHPLQTVNSIIMKFEKTDWTSENQMVLYIRANIKKNGTIKPYHTSMSCSGEGNDLKCSIDCDGGTAEVKWETAEKEGVITFINKGFMMYGGCGSETDENDWIWLKNEKGGDDIFKLYKMDSKTCRSIRSR